MMSFDVITIIIMIRFLVGYSKEDVAGVGPYY